MTDRTPRCDRCHRLHRIDLRCWQGRYARTICEQVYREKGTRCVPCRREGKDTPATTVDHIHPRALGGGDELRNLEPACVPHNSAKGKKTSSPHAPPPPIAGNGQPVSPRFRQGTP